MCECGCYSNAVTYQMPGPNGLVYLVKLLPACDYCSVGMCVEISRLGPANQTECEELKHTPPLPVSFDCDGVPVTVISVGVEKDELVKLAKQCAFDEVDDITLEVVADEMWTKMPQAPTIVMPDSE